MARLAVFAAMSCLAWNVPSSAQASAPPSIETESVSGVTSTDAMLEAQVNVHEAGPGAYYQFQLVRSPSEYDSEILCPTSSPPATDGCIGTDSATASPIGVIPGNTLQPGVDHPISLDLSGAGVTLQSGTTYHYRLLVARRVPTEDTIEWEPPIVYGADQTFTTPSGPPSIAAESVSHLTSTDATLEAQIDPQANQAGDYYQFQLVKDPGEYASEIICPTKPPPTTNGCIGTQPADALPIGWVCGSCEREQATQQVQLDLATAGVTLEPATTYHYRLIAARAVRTEDTIQWEAPTVYGADQTFTTLLPDGVIEPTTATTSPAPQLAPGAVENTGQNTAAAIAPASTATPPPSARTLTNSLKLAKALRMCAKKPKRQRARCKKHAHKQYGQIHGEK